MQRFTINAVKIICSILVLIIPVLSQSQVPIRILIITGENNHKWKETTPVLRQILESAQFEVKVSEVPAVLETAAMKDFHGILLNYNSKDRWGAGTEQALLSLVRGGKGLIVVHAANNAFPGWVEYEKMVGLIWVRGTAGHDRYGPMMVNITDQEHYITEGLEDFETVDELYHSLTQFSDFKVLATAFSKEKGRPFPKLMVKMHGKGRIFHTTLGHAPASMHAPGFVTTLQRGTTWAVLAK